MVSVGFMITQIITGRVSLVKLDDCEPDYLLEKVYYEDVSREFAEARCKTLCWKDLHTDSIKVDRLEDIKVNSIDFIRWVCYCDQNDCE